MKFNTARNYRNWEMEDLYGIGRQANISINKMGHEGIGAPLGYGRRFSHRFGMADMILTAIYVIAEKPTLDAASKIPLCGN